MKNTEIQKLIFVYNADSGLRNMILDSAHKILSPKTYQCSLCDITYGAFTENSIWKKFRKNATIEMEFLHKDEFASTYTSKFAHKYTFPIVLARVDGDLQVLVKTEELDSIKNSMELIDIVTKRL